jgi:hypothetical protein
MNVFKKIAMYTTRIFTGDILSDLKVGRYLPEILYTVLMTALYIIIGIAIDATLIQVEDNKKKIEELEIEYSVKMHTYSAQRKLENIEKNLSEKNIDIAFPRKPANKVE